MCDSSIITVLVLLLAIRKKLTITLEDTEGLQVAELHVYVLPSPAVE